MALALDLACCSRNQLSLIRVTATVGRLSEAVGGVTIEPPGCQHRRRTFLLQPVRFWRLKSAMVTTPIDFIQVGEHRYRD